MKKHHHLLIAIVIFLLLSSFTRTSLQAEEKVKKEPEKVNKTPGRRTKELGLLPYRKYIHYYKERKEKSIFSYLKAIYPAVEIIPGDVEIFLPENAAKLKQYKRVWIPGYALMFTQKMYDGMKKFVDEGGLLITSETMPIIDINEDYKFDRKEDLFFIRKKGGNPLLGIYGANSANFIEIKVVKETPITSGLELNEWLPLSPAGGRHVTGASSATVVIIARAKTKRIAKTEQPFLVYKQQSKGAAVYIATLTPDQSIKKLVTNLLSETTLNWLCEQ